MSTPSNKFWTRLLSGFANSSGFVRWLVIFLFSTLVGVMNFNRFYTNELAEGGTPNFYHYLICEMTGAYAVFVLLPVLFYFFKKFPLQRNNLLTRLPLHLLASLTFGFSHTLLMFFSRKIIYALLLHENYDYGHLGYRLVMEYNHQFFTYWLVYGIAYFINLFRENQKQKLKTAQLERQLTEARLQALQMQLNPHFLFNTLNMISSTMYDDVNAADKMMASLSDLLRKTLNVSNRPEHPLRNELDLANLYIEMMQARFQNQLCVKMEIAAETLDDPVPSFILQPLIENSIKHAMQNVQIAAIEISSQKKEGRLILSVKDNGRGISTDAHSLSQNGVGLSNTSERLEKLYGAAHRLDLRNRKEGGLEVTIEIPSHRAEAGESRHEQY
jgi:sensor histidine kinase YesM